MMCPKCGSTNIKSDRQLCSDPPIPLGFCQDCGAEWCLNVAELKEEPKKEADGKLTTKFEQYRAKALESREEQLLKLRGGMENVEEMGGMDEVKS